MFKQMSTHDRIVQALTAWDRKQSKKKGHNIHFLGIALNALAEVEEENPGASLEKIVSEAFEGRLHDFIIKYLAKEV